jgi:hypothetical protein
VDGERKSGIPEETLMPAPATTRTRAAGRARREMRDGRSNAAAAAVEDEEDEEGGDGVVEVVAGDDDIVLFRPPPSEPRRTLSLVSAFGSDGRSRKGRGAALQKAVRSC